MLPLRWRKGAGKRKEKPLRLEGKKNAVLLEGLIKEEERAVSLSQNKTKKGEGREGGGGESMFFSSREGNDSVLSRQKMGGNKKKEGRL